MTKVLEFLQTETGKLILNVIYVVVFFLIIQFVLKRISKYTKAAMDKAAHFEDVQKGKKITTSMTLLRSLSRYVLYFLFILFALNRFGFSDAVNNVLITAGIGSLALTLGAQTILGDVVTGIFLTFEHQFEVGDYIKVGEYEGIVTALSLRATYLNYRGRKVIIPNGQIKTVINYNREFNTASIVVPTPYEKNTEEVIKIIEKALVKYIKKNKELLVEDPKVLGITEFNESSVDITVVAKALPTKHWEVERGLRLIIKKEFDDNGISIPYKQIVIHQDK